MTIAPRASDVAAGAFDAPSSERTTARSVIGGGPPRYEKGGAVGGRVKRLGDDESEESRGEHVSTATGTNVLAS